MNIEVIEHDFLNPEGRTVQVWAVYYGPRLFTFSYAISPLWHMESIDFNVARRAA